jgi:hypothetical protein
MKKRLLFFFYLLLTLNAIAQPDTSITLRILDPKVCIDKAKYTIGFSYYFENKSKQKLILVDYYEPCFWEHSKSDSARTVGIMLQIEDENGNLVLPVRKTDSLQTANPTQYIADSTHFYHTYEHRNRREFHFNTSVLNPKAVMTNFFTMKLNKRKCFHPSFFELDFNKKYTVSIKYIAESTIHHHVNQMMVKKDDHVFVGEIQSNKVELCFK